MAFLSDTAREFLANQPDPPRPTPEQQREHLRRIRHADGPVPDAECPGGKEPHILIQLWEQYGQEAIVMIYSEKDCFVYTQHDAPYPITFQGLIKYLEQLPKPIWHFTN